MVSPVKSEKDEIVNIEKEDSFRLPLPRGSAVGLRSQQMGVAHTYVKTAPNTSAPRQTEIFTLVEGGPKPRADLRSGRRKIKHVHYPTSVSQAHNPVAPQARQTQGFLLVLHSGGPVCPTDKPGLFLGHNGFEGRNKRLGVKVHVPFFDR